MKWAAWLISAALVLTVAACAPRRPVAPSIEPVETIPPSQAVPPQVVGNAAAIAPEPEKTLPLPRTRHCPVLRPRVTIVRACEKQICRAGPVRPCPATVVRIPTERPQRGPTWQDFQSLISLGVGLNFIFGLFESLGERRLSSAQKRKIAILKRRERGGGKAPNPAHYATASILVGTMKGARWIGDVLGVYISMFFASACVGLLLYATEHANEPVPEVRVWLYILPLAWPAVAAIAMLLFTRVAALAKCFFDK